MVSPLGTLLSDSWASFRRASMAILAGAIVFGIILGIGQSIVGQRVAREASSALEGMGMNVQRMEDIQRRIQSGEELALEEIFGAMMELDEPEAGERMVRSVTPMFRGILPMIGASMLIVWLVSLIASAYFLLIALNDTLDVQTALARAPALIIPLFLLSLWIIVRTFVWVPVIGIVTGIILGPRFILSPVLLARDRKGVLESAKMSYAQTRGFWGKILGNVIVAIILALVAQVVAGFALALLGARIAGLLLPVVQMLITAFMTIFIVKLALTVEQNPQRV